MNGVVAGIVAGVVLYGVGIYFISNYMTRKQATKVAGVEDYYVAGRSLGAITMVNTIVMSVFSAIAITGTPATSYRVGIGFFGSPVGAMLYALLVPAIMYRLWLLGKCYGYLTVGDFFKHRYGSQLLVSLIGIVTVLFILPYVSVQFTAIAQLISRASEGFIGFWVMMVIALCYVMYHVMHGGNKSIAGTDTFAGFVGWIFTIIVSITFFNLIVKSMPDATAKIIADGHGDLLKMSGLYDNPVGYFGVVLAAGLSSICWPHVFVRSYMARNENIFRALSVSYPIIQCIGTGLFICWGIWVGRVAFPNASAADSEFVIINAALQYAPWVLVLLAMLVLSFGISTADSQLAVAAGTLEKDLIMGHKNIEMNEESSKGMLAHTRGWLILLGVLVLIITYFRPPILFTYAFAVSGSGFAQLVPLVFGGLYWKRANAKGAFAGLVAGIAVLLFTTYAYNPYPRIQPLLWALLINTAAFVTVSLQTAPYPKGADEVVGALGAFFKTRDTAWHKILIVLICFIYFQAIVGPFFLDPEVLLWGWMPLPILNAALLALESSFVGYCYATNRLYEPDGSVKIFTGTVGH